MIYSATETPMFIADEMVSLANVTKDSAVLEPSAGFGNLAFSIREAGGITTCIDLNERCCEHLRLNGFETYRKDFLKWETNKKFDAIIMCPPKNSVPHVQHAIKFLKPTGKLVALVREDSKDLDIFSNYYKPIEEDIFHINNVSVRSGLIIYEAFS